MVCLALELIGPWVVLGFNVGMEVFDELLLINVPGVRSSLVSRSEEHTSELQPP